MALRRAPKDVDPKTGARIASKSLYGKKAGDETISSWPDVRNMYKSGKIKIENLKNYDKPVVDYITGKTNKISDVEYDEPRLSVSKTATGGSKTDVRFDYRPGGSMYKKAYAAEGKNRPKEPEGMERQYYAGMASGKMGNFGSGGSRYKNPSIDVPVVKNKDPREDIGRIPTLKADKIITSSPRPRKVEEVESWSSPTRTKGGGSKLMTQKIPVKKSTSERQKGYTYGKERKMAAAYYGSIGNVLGEEGRYATSGALGDFQKTRKEDIKGLKKQKKEAIARQDKKDIREGIKSKMKDIREAKLAQKYVESLPNRYQASAGVAKGDIRSNTKNEQLPENSKYIKNPKRVVRTFTPEAMKGSTEQRLIKSKDGGYMGTGYTFEESGLQRMQKEKIRDKVRNLGPTKRTMPKNR
jgi:hypothetical protein